LGKLSRRGRIVVARVGDSQPAAGAQLVRLVLQLVTKLDQQVEHDLHRVGVSAKPKDLRADVRVQPNQFQAGIFERLLDRTPGRARLDRKTKLRIELA